MYGVSNNDIPEWKRILIMKKRSGKNGLCDPPIIENNEEKNELEDLKYGPGIVDRLRARFLNIGAKQVKPRRFSSLENLPVIPYRVNVRRQNGPVKKAQSMETLTAVKEDELPKPNTVKHVKKLFESPTEPAKERAKTFREPTSIVFDFRGRDDVVPHISCDPPPVSGIVFTGENVKLARSSLLETRNKNLSIQFDDNATSTFEYPSENVSPTDFDSSTAMESDANSRLSNYTPLALSANEEFELGVSNHRPVLESPVNEEEKDASADDTVSWSTADTADILF